MLKVDPMNASPFPVEFVGLPGDRASVLEPLVASAAKDLGLAEDVAGIRICGDALPGENGVWFRLLPGSRDNGLPLLALYCHADCFGSQARVEDAASPPRPVWELSEAPAGEVHGSSADFSSERSAIFLHHHLLTARDMVRGEIAGRNLPSNLAEAFGEAWAVNVDGRLARWGFPGYSPAERRSRFARVFAPAGILLPDHWQVFQSLWDGALANQKDVLGVVRRLPGL